LLPLDQLASDPILHWILYMKEPRSQAAKQPSSRGAWSQGAWSQGFSSQ
jgi:hypothetical protein